MTVDEVMGRKRSRALLTLGGGGEALWDKQEGE
jgi:hypothetical protein